MKYQYDWTTMRIGDDTITETYQIDGVDNEFFDVVIITYPIESQNDDTVIWSLLASEIEKETGGKDVILGSSMSYQGVHNHLKSRSS